MRCSCTDLAGLLDVASNGDGRHGQEESNPRPKVLMIIRRSNHYATRHATKMVGYDEPMMETKWVYEMLTRNGGGGGGGSGSGASGASSASARAA